MNELRDNDRLLADVLAEDASAGQREALLADTLRLVRRRRRFRQVRRSVYAFALIAVTTLLLLRHHSPANVIPRPADAYILVRTQPLRPMALIQTTPLPAANLVESVPTTAVLTTAASARQFSVLNDDDLLALTASNPAVLVRQSPGSAQLVFVNSLIAPGGTEN